MATRLPFGAGSTLLARQSTGLLQYQEEDANMLPPGPAIPIDTAVPGAFDATRAASDAAAAARKDEPQAFASLPWRAFPEAPYYGFLPCARLTVTACAPQPAIAGDGEDSGAVPSVTPNSLSSVAVLAALATGARAPGPHLPPPPAATVEKVRQLLADRCTAYVFAPSDDPALTLRAPLSRPASGATAAGLVANVASAASYHRYVLALTDALSGLKSKLAHSGGMCNHSCTLHCHSHPRHKTFAAHFVCESGALCALVTADSAAFRRRLASDLGELLVATDRAAIPAWRHGALFLQKGEHVRAIIDIIVNLSYAPEAATPLHAAAADAPLGEWAHRHHHRAFAEGAERLPRASLTILASFPFLHGAPRPLPVRLLDCSSDARIPLVAAGSPAAADTTDGPKPELRAQRFEFRFGDPSPSTSGTVLTPSAFQGLVALLTDGLGLASFLLDFHSEPLLRGRTESGDAATIAANARRSTFAERQLRAHQRQRQQQQAAGLMPLATARGGPQQQHLRAGRSGAAALHHIAVSADDSRGICFRLFASRLSTDGWVTAAEQSEQGVPFESPSGGTGDAFGASERERIEDAYPKECEFFPLVIQYDERGGDWWAEHAARCRERRSGAKHPRDSHHASAAESRRFIVDNAVIWYAPDSDSDGDGEDDGGGGGGDADDDNDVGANDAASL